MKNLLLLFPCIFTFISAQAQNKKAIEAFEKKDFKTAETAWRKDLQSKDVEDVVAAQFGIAKIYSNAQNADNQVDTAFIYADKANSNFVKRTEKEKNRLKESGISMIECSTLRASALSNLYKSSLDSKNLDRMDLTLRLTTKVRDYKFKKQREDLVNFRNLVVLNSLDSLKTYSETNERCQKYKKELSSLAIGDQERLQKKLLSQYISENGWEKIQQFEKENATNIYIKDADYQAFKSTIKSNDDLSYKDFVKNHDKSLWLSFARDTLAVRDSKFILNNGSIAECINFCRIYQDSKVVTELDSKINNFIKESESLAIFQGSIKKMRLEKMPKSAAIIYELIKKDGRFDAFQFYKDKFIFSNKTEFEKDFALANEANLIGVFSDAKYLSIQKQRYENYIKAATPSYAAFIALQKVIQEDIKNKKWEKAIETVKYYDEYFKGSFLYVSDLLKTLNHTDPGIHIENLGENVNSTYDEYSPTISADSKTLYFCRRSESENIYKTLNINDKWQKATPVDGLSVAGLNEAPLAISADGNNLLLFNNGIIKESKKEVASWSAAASISPNINTSTWQGEATLSSNGQVLIFESMREDIVGINSGNFEKNVDIFIAQKDKKGNWKTGINIGKVINTPFVERSPYLHPDMKTLYFCSEGHGGLGKLDVFKTTRLDDTWLNWSTPLNLGKEINTTDLDWGYKISTDGVLAYFSSNNDLYYVTPIPILMMPEKVATISGKVLGYDRKPITDAEIRIINLTTGEVAGTLRTDPSTGEYFAVLPSGQYGYEIIKEGHFPIHGNINTQNIDKQIDVKEDVTLYKYEEMKSKNISLPLRNLFFETNSFIIRPESYNELGELANLIKENKFKIEISGFTDNDGSPQSNITLSENRANEVMNYLISQGCDPKTMLQKGYGETKPLCNLKTDDCKAKNRRVEIKIKS